MIVRKLEAELRRFTRKKSVLLLGPRQVGKSTLLKTLAPDLTINLANEATYLEHLKAPELLAMEVAAVKSAAPLIYLDEIQRIPSLLNTIQALLDDNKSLRFILSGSSARKLSRGKANLLPGRVLVERLHPLTYGEVSATRGAFDLDRALQLGLLPEVYTDELGAEILASYAQIYLREEIQAEALVKSMQSYARFLDLAAELSGQFINYAKLSSDAEINKDTVRSYFEILEETLLIHRVPGYGTLSSARKARQKDKFYFFDVGVRNAVLKKTKSHFTDTEKGPLFEHFIFQQLKAIGDYEKKDWAIKTYRDDRGLEVDFILESDQALKLIEVKFQRKFRPDFEKNLNELEALIKTKKRVEKFVVYTGAQELKTQANVRVLPYGAFLELMASQ
jgi:predicted AAA+ superfamily ATPase